jgi:hypothetical protein
VYTKKMTAKVLLVTTFPKNPSTATAMNKIRLKIPRSIGITFSSQCILSQCQNSLFLYPTC